MVAFQAGINGVVAFKHYQINTHHYADEMSSAWNNKLINWAMIITYKSASSLLTLQASILLSVLILMRKARAWGRIDGSCGSTTGCTTGIANAVLAGILFEEWTLQVELQKGQNRSVWVTKGCSALPSSQRRWWTKLQQIILQTYKK